MSITFNTIGITLGDGTSVRVSSADGSKDITTSRSRMIINDAHTVDLPLGLLTVRDEDRFREQVVLRSQGQAPGALEEIRRSAIEDYNSVPKEQRRPGMRSAVTSAITQIGKLDRNASTSEIYSTVKDLGQSLFPSLADEGLGRLTGIIISRASLDETDATIINAARETLAFVDSMSRIASVTPAGWGLSEDIDPDDPQAEPVRPAAVVQKAERSRYPVTEQSKRVQFELFANARAHGPETKNPTSPAQDPDEPRRVWPPEPQKAAIEPAPTLPEDPAEAPREEPATVAEKKRWPPRKPAQAEVVAPVIAADAAAPAPQKPDAAQAAIDALDRMITGQPETAPSAAREAGARAPRAAGVPKPEKAAAVAADPGTTDPIARFLEGLNGNAAPGENDDDIYDDPFFLDADPVFEEDDRPSVFGA